MGEKNIDDDSSLAVILGISIPTVIIGIILISMSCYLF